MQDYFIHCTFDKKVNINSFKLHSHEDMYEIMLLLSVDAEYISEGSVYTIDNNDIVIARPDEMHRIHHLSESEYGRICIQIPKRFFKEYKCECYEEFFKKYDYGTYNKISSAWVMDSGIYDIFMKIRDYSEDYKKIYTPAVAGCILEILHILNHNEDIFDISGQTNLVRNVISYINNNLGSKISLDTLAEKHFISKYYLCRIFKSKTGYTLTGYINHKRIIRVKELCKKGTNISRAAIESGFGNYSAFYKAYLKETGEAPKSILNN